MPRWEPNAAERLQEAAFDLFETRGFEGASVAEIAERAGLTQRTFYNHYADKREVLFDLSARFHDEVLAGVAATPPDLAPLDAVVEGYRAADRALFAPQQGSVRRRTAIVAATPSLMERELSKRSTLEAAIAELLEERGADPESAHLAAAAGALVQASAMTRWMHPDESRSIDELLDERLRMLRAATR